MTLLVIFAWPDNGAAANHPTWKVVYVEVAKDLSHMTKSELPRWCRRYFWANLLFPNPKPRTMKHQWYEYLFRQGQTVRPVWGKVTEGSCISLPSTSFLHVSRFGTHPRCMVSSAIAHPNPFTVLYGILRIWYEVLQFLGSGKLPKGLPEMYGVLSPSFFQLQHPKQGQKFHINFEENLSCNKLP